MASLAAGLVVAVAARSGFRSFDDAVSACIVVCGGAIFAIPFQIRPLLARLAVREWREQICLTGMETAPWLRERLKPELVASALPTLAALLAMWALVVPMLGSLERAWAVSAVTLCALMVAGFAWIAALQELEKLCGGNVGTASSGRMFKQFAKLVLVSLPFIFLCLVALRAYIVPGLLMAVWLHSGMMRRINRHFANACRAYCEFG